MSATRPIRVLVNALHAKTGGGLTYLQAMLPRLAGDPNLEIHLLFHANQIARLGPLDPRLRPHPVAFRDGFLGRLLWEQLILPWHAWALADVTFSPANFGPLLAPRPVILLRNALAVGEREDRADKRLYWAALGLMTRLSVWRAAKALAVSDYAARAMNYGRREVAVVWHGVDHERFRADDGAREDFLLAVGDITVQKNFHTLIEALAALPGLSLRIAGRFVDQGYLDRLKAQITRLGLGDRVRLLGSLTPDDLALQYRRCALFVMASTVETFGHPLVEAMASGCPILCADATALPEILADGGRLFDPDDAPGLAGAIRELLFDPAGRSDLSAKARRRAGLFSWDQTAQRTAQRLTEAAQPAKPDRQALWGWAWVGATLFLYLAQFGDLVGPILAALKG
jgi:glycosyltransferase involved in cell wall biosynthesis